MARKPVDATAGCVAPQRNFTDPRIEDHAKVSNKGFDQRGNAQIVCNEEQIILAADVTNQANDQRQVQPMVSQAQENLTAAGVAEKIGALDADSGYYRRRECFPFEARRSIRTSPRPPQRSREGACDSRRSVPSAI